MTKETPLKKEKKAKWRSIISEQKDSKKTQKEWCEENRVSYWSFKRWNTKLSKEDEKTFKKKEVQTAAFIKVEEKREADVNEAPDIKVRVGKFLVEIPAGFKKPMLSEICEVLESL